MVSQRNFIVDPASAAPRTFACSVGIADIRPAKVRLGLRPSLRMTDGRSVSAKSFVCSDRGRRSLQVCANKVYFPVKMLLSRLRSEYFASQQFRLPLGANFEAFSVSDTPWGSPRICASFLPSAHNVKALFDRKGSQCLVNFPL